jgi:hypothetical protein
MEEKHSFWGEFFWELGLVIVVEIVVWRWILKVD